MRSAVTAFPHTAQICDISSDRRLKRDVFEEPESNSAAKIPMYGLPALLGRPTYVCNLHTGQISLANRPGGEVTGRVSPMWRFPAVDCASEVSSPVPFELIAARYEQRSMMITANQPLATLTAAGAPIA